MFKSKYGLSTMRHIKFNYMFMCMVSSPTPKKEQKKSNVLLQKTYEKIQSAVTMT